MKRDMDIVRKLLVRAEAAHGSVSITDAVETYHVRLMIDAGLIKGRISDEILPAMRRAAHTFTI